MLSKGSTDQPAKIDMFGIGNYISGLCSFINDCETPMTIAVQGDWGSGKTSVMQLVIDEINKKEVYCVEFNAWQFSQFSTEETLALSMIQTIVGKLETDSGEASKEVRSVTSTVSTVLGNLGKRGLYTLSDMLVGSSNTEDLKKSLEEKYKNDYKSVNETISTLKDQFQNCVNTFIKAKTGVQRLMIFIDDLDRLQPLRAVELLEVLKIFLDCQNCVFVLAIDYNVVVSGVKRKYGDDFKADKGRSFFDKIIQVPFKMPVAQYDIYNFVKTTFEGIAAVKCEENDVKNYVSLINASIGSNPRSMKRLFNSYLLLLKVIDKEILEKNENKKALFAILCMQQRFENLYNYIVINREDIDAEFFNKLAFENLRDILDKSILTDGDEPEKIQEFIVHFNKTINTSDNENIDDDSINQIRDLLKSSSVTATDTADSDSKKRPTFVYNGDTYMTRGKPNLGNLALRLILDYIKENEKSKDDFMQMINSRIPCYYSDMRRLGLTPVVERGNPLLQEKDAKKKHYGFYYFDGEGEILKFGEAELLAANNWGANELTTLVNILGYDNKVTSNVK